MDTQKKGHTTVEEYIHTFPETTQVILQKIRGIVREIVPDAEETISYQMPTFKYKGKYLVYFAGWKEHIGFYATPEGNEAFKEELSEYQGAKGSVKFPFSKPIPYELIKKIVTYRKEKVDML